MKAADFPDLDKATFMKPPVKSPLDGIEYDGNKPNEYLEKLPLGLKGNQKPNAFLQPSRYRDRPLFNVRHSLIYVTPRGPAYVCQCTIHPNSPDD